MILILSGCIIMFVVFFVCLYIFPSKKYMSDIYQEMYVQQKEQTKALKDMRNAFFAKSRKSKGGK